MKVLILNERTGARGALSFGIFNWFLKFVLLTVTQSFLLVTPAYAMDIGIEWNANTESNLAGYKVYYKAGSSGEPYNGTGADQGSSPITIEIEDLDDPNNPGYTLTGLDDNEVYFLVVTAYNDEGLESDYSNEITTNDIPYILNYPLIDYDNNTIDVTYSEDGLQNVTDLAGYSFSPSLNFAGTGNDITHISGNTYRLAMASIPDYTIFTLTVSNITDVYGSPVTPSTVTINDNDDDDMADDWESIKGVDDPNGDPDSDGLSNVQEFNGGGSLSTDPNDPDTDGDDLLDGWEISYGLDPLDATGINGKDGDPDNDGWTNYEESLDGTDPGDDTSSPALSPPEVKEVIPHPNAGISDDTRIPNNTSFSARIEDSSGIDITDTGSIRFTITDGVNDPYMRDLSDGAVFRVVKLADDDDTQVTELWAVYDRSGEVSLGNYPYDADVNIKVDAKDRLGVWMAQTGYDFNVESEAEHEQAQNQDNLPDTVAVAPDDSGLQDPDYSYDTGIQVTSGDLEGAKIIYNCSERMAPTFGSTDELPTCNISGFGAVGVPVNLQPSIVFTVPVKIFIPCPGKTDVSGLSIALYTGTGWVLACDAGGNVQPSGNGWMVPGSRVNHNNGSPSTIEIKVHHFSGAQVGADSSSLFRLRTTSGGGGGGGCFLDTIVSKYSGKNHWNKQPQITGHPRQRH